MITLRALTLARGSKTLLEDINLTLHQGQRIGLVGANGAGKSSLFALLRGELHQDAGDLDMPPRIIIAHVAQETPALDRAAIDFVLDGDAELRSVERALIVAEQKDDGHELAELHHQLDVIGGYTANSRAAALLHGLGFASVLQEVGLQRSDYAMGLIGFNIGVELGQLTVILTAFLLTGYWFREKSWYRQRIVLPASAAIALVGAFWAVERIWFA